MATELERAVKKLNQALSQASEEERTEFLEQNFQPDQFELTSKATVPNWKKFVSQLGRLLARAGFIVLRVLLWILKAPFFILCWFLDGVYRVVILDQYRPFQSTPTSINDNITTIIVIIAGILSLIGTALQYKGEID